MNVAGGTKVGSKNGTDERQHRASFAGHPETVKVGILVGAPTNVMNDVTLW